jgi:hypothetical protein
MGKGRDIAREFAPEHAAVLDDFKDQLMIVLLNRLGSSVDIPVSEADAMSGFIVSMSVHDAGTSAAYFHFVVRKKQ